MSEMDAKEMRKFIRESKWITSKSMPEAPHQYTLRENTKSNSRFDRVVLFIRKHGYRKPWVNRRGRKIYYTYLNVGKFCYWTMGWPVDETILINRAHIK